MAETPFNPAPATPKTFWKRPEGVTGTVFLLGLLAAGGYVLVKALPTLIALASNMLYLSLMLLALGAVIYMVLDPKMRNLVSYGYKSIMRWVYFTRHDGRPRLVIGNKNFTDTTSRSGG